MPIHVFFGLFCRPTQSEREAQEGAESVIRKQERLAAMTAVKERVLARQQARQVERTANKAKAAETAAKLKVERDARKADAAAAAATVTAAPVVEEAVAAVVEEEAVAAVAEEEAVAAVVEEVADVVPEPTAPVPEPVAESSGGGGGGEITPKTIKQLRDATGAGMMDCKKALIEAEGDQEVAAENLRKKGLSKADKKASRVAAEGRIAVATAGSKAVMVEVNCETDFVAKDDSFLGFCKKVASAAVSIDGDAVESLMATEVEGEALETTRQGMVAKIGENIQVRRMASRGGAGTTVGAYVHMNRMGVLVETEGGSEQLCVDIAMHIAAMNPPFATADDVPQEVLEKEKRILSEQALESGKKPEIVEKMVEGRIRKFLEEKCLVSQAYVKDGDKTVGKLLEENGAKIIGFTRLVVGEGIEKKQDDFAAEVAKMAGIKTDEPEPATV
jgi:elongation factor Ts